MAGVSVSVAPQTSQKSPRPSGAPAKIWFFRAVTALVIPFIILLLFEGGLRLAGYGRPTGFLIPDEVAGWFRTNPDFTGFFLPRNFDLRPLNFRLPAQKPAGALRVVVLGESAAQGVPAPAFGFAPQLRAMLRARYPGREIEVINTGIVAINSHVVRRIARDLAPFAPDLFVVYLGNNEVVGPYGPGSAFLAAMPPPWLIRLSLAVKLSRTSQLMAALLEKLPQQKRPVEWGGMAMFVEQAVRGNDPRLDGVYANFADNLRAIVATAADTGAPTLLCTVVANLKDSPPFLSLHRAGLAGADQAAWQQAFDRGKLAWLLGEDDTARRTLRTAWQLDPEFAETAYLLGTLELRAGNLPEARRLLAEALHWDALRFRPDTRINAIIREVAAERPAAVRLVDAAAALGADPGSTAKPAGRELLFEHVHFDWDGNFRLAGLVARSAEAALEGRGWPAGNWPDSVAVARALAYSAHARLRVLQRNEDIVHRPPFSNQLTYAEDQAKLAREIARLEAEVRAPGYLVAARVEVAAAIAADPRNPDLAKRAEELALDAGDVAGALAEARRAADLLPYDLALNGDEASLLSQLGRFPEAQARLQEAARRERDPEKLVPMSGALEIRRRDFSAAQSLFDGAIARHPGVGKLRLMRANLMRIAGREVDAEKELRAILESESGDEAALEGLVSLLGAGGRTAEAEQVSLAFAETQTRNQLNDLRVAQLQEARGDLANSVRFLEAATRCGPVPTGLTVSLARQLHQLGRTSESLLQLAQARRLSVLDGDPEITASIDDTIKRLRATAP